MVIKNNFSQDDLDPEILKIRDQIINKIGDKPLDEINSIVKKLLNDQMDENTRLGVLAARLKIIRLKIENLYENKIKTIPTKKTEPQTKTSEQNLEEEKKNDEWIRIKLLESSNINGKQIDKGVIVDVKKLDGQKLINSKKAEEVKEEKISKKVQTEENKEEVEVKDQKVDQKSEENEAKETEEEKIEDSKSENPTKDLESKNKKDLLKQHEEKTTEQKKIVSDTQGASSSLEKPKELSSVKDNEKGEVKSGEAPEVPVNPKESSSVNGDEKAEVKSEDTSSTSLKNKEIESETK